MGFLWYTEPFLPSLYGRNFILDRKTTWLYCNEHKSSILPIPNMAITLKKEIFGTTVFIAVTCCIDYLIQ